MRSEADFLMKEKNGREEYSASEEWTDSNEQEEKKEGFERPRLAREEKREVRKVLRAEMPIPLTRKLPKEAEEKKPPILKEEKKAIVEEEESIPWQKNDAERSFSNEPREERSRGKGGSAALLTVLSLLAIVISLGSVALGLQYLEQKEAPSEGEIKTPTTGEERVIFIREYDQESGLLTLPELYEKYSDAVVSIRTKSQKGSGVGSGFFLREDGYIATVAHVVDGAEELTVVTGEGKSFEATLISSDAMTDLALLKIEGEGFPTLSFGTSEKLLTGERVIAIGTPASLDYAGTLCTGEISYCLRTVKVYDSSGQVLQKKMKLLQTTAPVNPGNSGCPLFDEYGHVVGIITMKLGSDYVGLGFAIPSDGASAILGAMMRGETLKDELLSLVSVSAPRLGILGEASVLQGIAGVKIVRFSTESCDAALKLREGDLIVQIEGEPIATTEKMTSLIQTKNPGESVLVTVLRSGQRLTFEVILEKS